MEGRDQHVLVTICDFWFKALGMVALQESDIAAQRMNATMRANYQDYLNGGPALGLGRQHRMSRTAVGWIPTKVGSSKLLVIDDLDDTDGLSAEDMAAVLRHDCSVLSPLDAQQEAEDQADKWGGIWAVGTKDNGTIASLHTCGDWDVPAELFLDELLKSLASSPTPRGSDGTNCIPKPCYEPTPSGSRRYSSS